jgi:hypothetical protein
MQKSHIKTFLLQFHCLKKTFLWLIISLTKKSCFLVDRTVFNVISEKSRNYLSLVQVESAVKLSDAMEDTLIQHIVHNFM